MFFRAGALPGFSRLRAKAIGFCSDRRGVAAVEFAFIAPLLLAMYFVTMEFSQGIETSKKVSRVGSMVADLVTQQQTVVKADLEAIMKIGESTLQPYNRSKPTIIITAIKVSDDAALNVTVEWSRKMVDGVYSIGTSDSTTTIPSALRIKGSFLIRVESKLEYKPVITWAADSKQQLGLTAAFDNLSMGETYYLRPRMSQTITCSNC